MLLGQLYYFEKKLDSVRVLVDGDAVDKVEIIGLESEDLKLLKGFPSSEIYTRLLTIFTQKYSSILETEELFSALAVWNLIVSPYKSTQDFKRFPIFSKVSQWMDGDRGASIDELLDDIEISHEDDEFAIIYGLKVLKTLLGYDNLDAGAKVDNFDVKKINPDADPKILVVCSLVLSPFITYLNCIFVDSQLPQTQLIDEIVDNMTRFTAISLILIEENKMESISNQLKKRLEVTPLIAPLNLDLDEKTGYFDNLVKKTLGVRLV
jgi:vacuolar-type H+-ATPase subunit F/Vma7